MRRCSEWHATTRLSHDDCSRRRCVIRCLRLYHTMLAACGTSAWVLQCTGGRPEIKFRKRFRSQTDSDRNSFAANRNRSTARSEADVPAPWSVRRMGTKACPSAQRRDYAKAASCGTQCARSSSPSTTIASSFSSMVSRTAHQTTATRATTPVPALFPRFIGH